MSLNKPTCILSRPLVEKFFENGCTNFTMSSPESFNTKFDGHNLDHIVEVHDCSDDCEDPDYLISVTFHISHTFSWIIAGIQEPRKGFVKMFEQLENNCDNTTYISGGRKHNSSWSFYCRNGRYKLCFDVIGPREDSTVDLSIPKEQGDECIRIMKKVYQAVESQ